MQSKKKLIEYYEDMVKGYQKELAEQDYEIIKGRRREAEQKEIFKNYCAELVEKMECYRVKCEKVEKENKYLRSKLKKIADVISETEDDSVEEYIECDVRDMLKAVLTEYEGI